MRRLSGGGVGAAVGAVVFAVAAAAGCGVPSPDRGVPEDLYDLGRLCEDGAPFAETVLYSGPGPHPVVVFPPRGGYRTEEGSYTERPPFAAADAATAQEPAPGAVQLVACQQPAERRLPDDRPLATCAYKAVQGAESWANVLYPGRYRLTLYEARTGRVVGEVLAVSTAPGPDDCADVSFSSSGDGTAGYSFPTPADFATALHNAITAPAAPAPGPGQ